MRREQNRKPPLQERGQMPARAEALNDEELDAVSGGVGNLELRKPQTLSGDELDELLGGTQAIGVLGKDIAGMNTFTVL